MAMDVAGRRLMHYQVLEKLGEGGMGVVYRAFDTHLDRYVAIKVLPPKRVADPDRKRRFVQEAKAASALNHPNIITIHDIGSDAGNDFIVMEYIAGRTLDRAIAERLPLPAMLRVAAQIASALECAHAAGIIHRDLKPSNVMVDSSGHAKVLDFGLVKLTEPASEGDATRTLARTAEGAVVGTVAYMSPEQATSKPLDRRSDLFSLGAVLYEMIAGRRAFNGDSAVAILTAVIRDEPPPLREACPQVPPRVEAIVRRCLRKNREDRYPSAAALAADIESCCAEISATSSGAGVRVLARKGRSPKVLVPALLALAVLGVLGVKSYGRYRNRQWAATEALPEIIRLVDLGRIAQAYAVAEKAEQYLPGNPMIEKEWPVLSRTVTIETTPPGAEVFRKDYDRPDAHWQRVGVTPLRKVRAPRSVSRWKIEKTAYTTVEGLLFPNPFTPAVQVLIPLDEAAKSLGGMVKVVTGSASLALDIVGFEALPAVRLDDFWIDRFEVTNTQFKQFVDAGGYRKRDFWKQPFRMGARTLSWEEAMTQFRDTTGRPGPATWQQGDFPQGQGDYPVSGVSWYEAAAYAEFAGKSLPTIWHWNAGAGIYASASIVPASNFSGQGLAPVGKSAAMGTWGAYDMAGNVKEWCWNEAKDGMRYILGGAWDEPAYMFTDSDARDPFDRPANAGFRCAKYGLPAGKAADPVISPARDFRSEKPCSDELFHVYRSMYSYDKKPLNAKLEGSEDLPDYQRERITIDAAYGSDRLPFSLYLPKKAKPPYQVLVFYPGSSVIQARAQNERNTRQIDFVLKSGRAVIAPVLKGTFERHDDLESDYPNMTASYRDHVIAWSKDIGRALDYAETRPELDRAKVGFFGLSWGGAMGPIMSAVEDRIKVNVLLVPGFYRQKPAPEVDQLNFAPRVKAPTLMLNGRYDFFFPLETSQLPMFRLVGTSKEHKRHVVYPTGHNIPRNEVIRETLDWLDRYLGPVQ